jgi:hypothetical protein
MTTWNDDPYYLVSFGIHKSRRYHAKMSGLYQGISDLILSLNAIAGAGAFIALIGGKDTLFAQILVGVVALGSALDRVLGFSKRAKRHYDLCRRFTELAASLENWEATENNRRKAAAARLRLEAEEPTIKRLVDLQARNEELRARGYSPEHFVPLSLPQRVFGYFFTFGMRRLERWRDARSTPGSVVSG